MNLNILEAVILILVVLFAVSGFRKGFVKKLASMVSLVLSVSLVSAALPQITAFLKEETPVYAYIQEQCTQLLEEQTGMKLPKKEQEKNPGTFTRIEQMELIGELPLPEELKDILLDYNNEEGYKGLKVTNFTDYIVNFIASSVLNVLAFIVSVIAVQLLLWAVLTVLRVLSHIPVIHFVNRLAGMALGVLQALFVIWIFFLILSMLSATEFGMQVMALVQKSEALTWLYESNLFLRVVLRAAAILRADLFQNP